MTTPSLRPRSLPLWVSTLLPVVALGLMLAFFAFGDPLAAFQAHLPPIESLSVERVQVTAEGFELTVMNGGPDPVTVAQVMVDDAYWQFSVSPSATIPRLGRAEIHLGYPWVEAEPNIIRLVTSTGLTFDAEVPLAVETPTPGWNEFLRYGLVGIYVGIIPVALGLLWFPAMRRLGRKGLGAVLALTLGLLVFLLVDTLLEALEIAGTLPGVFQGVALILFAALLTWLVLLAVTGRRSDGDKAPRGVFLATMIALGIGLHNLGEGMAIGAAFALGEAALGSFLVLGFTLHNITEGVGIAAPLTPGGRSGEGVETPKLLTFVGLTLLAGAPAIVGAWIGGFAFNPILAAVFLGIGAGAIWQVIVEVGRLLRGYAERDGTSVATWPNVGGFTLGLAIMYVTALLVKF